MPTAPGVPTLAGMDWASLLNAKWDAWKGAWDEALVRDKAEGEKLKLQGYTFDGSWKSPGASLPDVMDGPGSYVSRMKHLEVVAKERGLDQDIGAIKKFVEKLKGLSHR